MRLLFTHFRRLSRFGVLAVVSLAAFSASAQDGRADSERRNPDVLDKTPEWAVIAASLGSSVDSAIDRISDLFEGALTRAGGAVYPSRHVRTQLVERVSQPFRDAPANAFAKLARADKEFLETVAFGHYDRLRQRVPEFLKWAEPYVPSFGRRKESSRQLEDICLYLVQGLLRQHKNAEADAQAMECLRLAPNLVPNPNQHPPYAVACFEQARQRLTRQSHATLAVNVSSRAETACAVRLNGRRLGNVPLAKLILPPGKYYVQVECDESTPGRIREVVVGSAGTVDLRVATALESSLNAGKRYGFRYAGSSEQKASELGDAGAIVRDLGLRGVMVVLAESEDAVRVDRIDSVGEEPKLVASVRLLKSGLSDPIATDAAGALLAGKSLDFTSGKAVEMDLPELENRPRVAAKETTAPSERENVRGESAPAEGSSYQLSMPGLILGGTGVALLGVGWVLYGDWARLQSWVDSGQPSDTTYLDLVDKRDARGTHVLLVGGLGLAALTASLPFLLPEEESIPWWAWVSGGAGVVLTVVSAIVWSQHNSCASRAMDGQCSRIETTVPMGPFLMMHAVPLLSVPLVYGMRSWLKSDKNVPTASVLPEGGLTLGWQGRF